MISRIVAVLAVLLIAGCARPGPNPTPEVPVSRIDFAQCPWNGLNGTPPSCESASTRYTYGDVPSDMPCLDESAPGTTTIHVRKEIGGPVVEITPEPGPLWFVAAIFGDDVEHAHTWFLPQTTSWTYLEGAPTTGPVSIFLTSFQLTIANATGPQRADEIANQTSEIRWVGQGANLVPLVVLGDPPTAYVDATLPLGAPPFQRYIVNARMIGADYEILFSNARNIRADLDLRDPNPNGLGCALPA